MSPSLYDSLVLGGAIELAGGPNGVPSANPMCTGAVFKLDPESWDLGDPQPTTDFIATLAVDGERPFGTRTSDRTPEITVNILAPDYLTLAGAEELLLSTLEQQEWTMVWTPRLANSQIAAGQVSLPVVFDCFRAEPSKKKWGGPTGYNNEGPGGGPVSQIVVKFECLPYGRSDTKTQLAFTSPIAAYNAPSPPPAPVVLDNFTTINSAQFTQAAGGIIGPYTAYWDPASFGFPDGAGQPLGYGRTFASPVSMTGMTALKHWLGLGSRYYFNHYPRGRTKVTISYTLTDISGNTLEWTAQTKALPISQNPQSPAFSLVSVRIPQPSGDFNLAKVISYRLGMYNHAPSQLLPGGEFRWTCVTLDSVTAYPSTVILGAPSNRGVLYHVNGVAGTHFAPVSVVAQSAPTAGSATVITAAGPGFYTVPASTVYVGATAIGGGGPGATMTVSGVGGGGGGAELAGELVLPGSAAGVVIPYSVGAGGVAGTAPVNGQASVFGPVPGQSLVVTANGGTAAATNSISGVAGASGSGNSIEYPGGAGRTSTGGLAGGGGSSAGTAAAGNAPAGASSTSYTSSGSFTIPSGAGPVTLTLIGAGGGGGGGSNGAGGGGGEAMQVTLTLTAGSYPFTIGAGGTAGTGVAAGGTGGSTSITIGATTYLAYGGYGGTAYGGLGGYLSPGPGEEPGGAGGYGYPYSGGGGSSAAAGSPGNPGSTAGQAGIAPTGGGNGGAGSGANFGVAGSAGQAPGGGGGGAAGASHNGGAGAAGQLTVAYSAGGAPTTAGGIAPAGGGNGGAGAASTGAGTAGSQPGGGGGSGDSAGATEDGGNGGAGEISVTPWQNTAFTTLLLHRPGLQSPSNLNPLVPLNGAAPGAVEFPVQAIQQGSSSWGFEDGTVDSWTGTNATVASSLAWSNTGLRSLLITAAGGAGTWGAGSPSGTSGLPIAPGQQVTAAGTVKNPGTAALADVEIGIGWYTTGGSLISTSTSATRSVAAAGIATLTLTSAAPSTAAYANVQILDAETRSAGVTIAIDDLSVGPGVNARFDGTYTGLLVAASWNTPAASRTLQLTVNQYEYPGGTKWSTSTTAVTVVPNSLPNGTPFVNLGNITLPGKALPADNTGCYFTVQVTDSNTSDTFWDLIFIDNNGQCVLLAEPSGSGYATYYFDEPDSKYDLGGYYGSQAGRPDAISVTDAVQILSGGPLTLQPGDNLMLAYSLAGAPTISVEYYPRWFHQRLE
jgi:hypothetical protein